MVAAGTVAALELTDQEGDYINDALAIGAFGLATANVMTVGLESAILGWGVTRAGSAVATVAPFVAAAGLGYALGATAGTIIAETVFGQGEEAFDLYTNFKFEEGGILYETADILGNASIIASHYADIIFDPSNQAGGRGNPNHPDYQEPGIVTAYREMYGV